MVVSTIFPFLNILKLKSKIIYLIGADRHRE
jgi:hypothetical protein